MPLPLLPLLSIGAGVLGQGANIAATAGANRAQRKFSEKMYERQRTDALTDRAFENQYNSPAEQMNRLKQAGLNPNLVYGNGSAQQESASARQSSVPGYSPKPVQVDTGFVQQGLMAQYDVELRQAQTDNLRAAKDVAIQQAAATAAQTAKTIADTKRTGVQTEQDQFNLDLAKQLETVSLEQARANLQKTNVETGIAINADERAAAMNSQSIRESVERILKMRLEKLQLQAQTEHTRTDIERLKHSIELLKYDERIKALDADLADKNIKPSDPAWMRSVGIIVNSIKGAIKNKPGQKPAPTYGESNKRRYEK